MSENRRPIVVAVSPSTGAPAALAWAEQEADRRGAPLRAIMVFRHPRASSPSIAAMLEHDTETEAVKLLDSLVRKVIVEADEVEQWVIRGATAPSIAAAASDAQLLVVGEPGKGKIAGIRATLIAPQLVYRASCPVVVMPLLEREAKGTVDTIALIRQPEPAVALSSINKGSQR
jgi:nucleotide-binding universal stress UspA family protein